MNDIVFIGSKLLISGNLKHAFGVDGNGYIAVLQFNNGKFQNEIFKDFLGKLLDGIALWRDTILTSGWKDFDKGSSIFTYRIFSKSVINEQGIFIPEVADFSLSDNRTIKVDICTYGKITKYLKSKSKDIEITKKIFGFNLFSIAAIL